MSTFDPPTNREVELSFSVEETNLVLTSLGQQPYYKVHLLIERILMQIQEQLQSAQPSAPQSTGSVVDDRGGEPTPARSPEPRAEPSGPRATPGAGLNGKAGLARDGVVAQAAGEGQGGAT